MRFERVAWNVDSGFDRRDPIIHDHSDWHFPQPHPDHFAEADRRVCNPGPNPKAEEIEKDNAQDEREEREHRDADKIKRLHGSRLMNVVARGKSIPVVGTPRCGVRATSLHFLSLLSVTHLRKQDKPKVKAVKSS